MLPQNAFHVYTSLKITRLSETAISLCRFWLIFLPIRRITNPPNKIASWTLVREHEVREIQPLMKEE